MNTHLWVLVALLLVVALLVGQPPSPVRAAGTNFYVDSVHGSDSNAGTTAASPWKSLAKVQSNHFLPGDTVNFKRGSSWTGGLSIRDSGTSGSPITFRDYGTGARPTISNPGSSSRVIFVYASWVVVQGLLLKDSGDAGIEIATGADHNVIQDVELTNTGMGISIGGQYNLATNNYVHDLHMIVNTPGGDDDYGAFGFLVLNSNNEISFNRCINCRAPSYDYGYDGGVVEIYSNGDNAYIHNNYGKASEGFMEVGSAVARNVRVAYNISDNNYGDFACLHVDGTFSSTIDNLRMENNTIINSTAGGSYVIDCAATMLSATQFLFRNNIVYSRTSVFYQSAFTHTNNVYYLLNGQPLGFTLGSGEQIANPLFVSPSTGDYRLQSSSPAINAGIDLGYTFDFQNRSVPEGGAPDAGANESQIGTVSPTAGLFLPLIVR